MQRIGTESEKGSVEKEVAELKARLAQRPAWEKRRAEIDAELARVWVGSGGEELPPPPTDAQVKM